MACRYRRADHADFWVWSHDFFEAPVEDLRHIAGLEVRFSVEGGVLRVREILEGTER